MMFNLGVLLFMIGGAAMDSSDRTVPVIMVLVGLAIMGITAIKENSLAHTDQSNVQGKSNK